MKKGGSGQHSWYALIHTHFVPFLSLTPTPYGDLLCLCRGSLGHEYEYEREGEMDAAGQFEVDDEARDQVFFDTATGTIVGNLDAESDISSVDGGATSKATGGRLRSSSTASNPGTTDDERARARKFRTGSFTGTRTVDLASIARTSVGVSSSPPAEFTIRPASSR
jgi:hypothetical protein